MVWRLTGRTFWGHGGIGSDPATALLDVPLVDRLALEMAAHEESERRAMEGELQELTRTWRESRRHREDRRCPVGLNRVHRLARGGATRRLTPHYALCDSFSQQP
jgi:hypothetical protein